MENRKFRFSNEEDLVIIRNVEQYPDNIKIALQKAVEELNTEPYLSQREGKERSFQTTSSRYYISLKKSDHKILFTGSVKGFTNNTKNTQVNRDTGLFPENRTLNKVEWVTKIILSLTNEEKDFIVNFFKNVSQFNKKKK
nr:MAG TPA: hypothetical protein [Caudoviricetes sp.]